MWRELVLYVDPVIGQPSISGDIVVHGYKVRKVLNHDVRLRKNAYLVRVSNVVESSVIGSTFYSLATIDTGTWITRQTANLGRIDI